MTTEHLIGIGDDKPRETQATHGAQGQIYLDMKYNAPAAMLYPRSAIDAAVTAERERIRGAILSRRITPASPFDHSFNAGVVLAWSAACGEHKHEPDTIRKLKEHQELLRTALRTAIFEIERRGDDKKLCASLRAALVPPNGKAGLDS